MHSITTRPDHGLSTSDAASFLGVNPVTLRRWRRRGEGPAYIKLGPQIFKYRLCDLRAFLKPYTNRPVEG